MVDLIARCGTSGTGLGNKNKQVFDQDCDFCVAAYPSLVNREDGELSICADLLVCHFNEGVRNANAMIPIEKQY